MIPGLLKDLVLRFQMRVHPMKWVWIAGAVGENQESGHQLCHRLSSEPDVLIRQVVLQGYDVLTAFSEHMDLTSSIWQVLHSTEVGTETWGGWSPKARISFSWLGMKLSVAEVTDGASTHNEAGIVSSYSCLWAGEGGMRNSRRHLILTPFLRSAPSQWSAITNFSKALSLCRMLF